MPTPRFVRRKVERRFITRGCNAGLPWHVLCCPDRKRRGAAPAASRRIGGVWRRFDFWVVLIITLIGAFFFTEALRIDGISSWFPQAVYASVAGLGC